MLQAAADILIGTRQRLANSLKDLPQEKWFEQPEGFTNNVAWNVGHLVLAQQGLCYQRCGVTPPIGMEKLGEMRKMYGGGTSPADWDENPDTDELLKMLTELPAHMTEDIAAGKFDGYEKPEPQEGRFPPPDSVLHAFIFNQYHEGLHAGTIGEILG